MVSMTRKVRPQVNWVQWTTKILLFIGFCSVSVTAVFCIARLIGESGSKAPAAVKSVDVVPGAVKSVDIDRNIPVQNKKDVLIKATTLPSNIVKTTNASLSTVSGGKQKDAGLSKKETSKMKQDAKKRITEAQEEQLRLYAQDVIEPARNIEELDKWRATASVIDPETMKYANDILDKNIKTPCFDDFKSMKSRLVCLPFFYIAGSFQAGSGSLYSKVLRHPDVVQADVSRWQFWAEENKGMSEWINGLAPAAHKVRANPFNHILVDGSSSTFAFYWAAGTRAHRAFQAYMTPCWKSCTDKNHGNETGRDACVQSNCYKQALMADKKAASAGGMPWQDVHVPLIMRALYYKRPPRLVVLVRDPVERIHSAYWTYSHYNSKYGKTPQGFLKYVLENLGAFKRCTEKGNSVRECTLYFEALGSEEEKVFFHCDQVMRGMYATYLEIWYQYMPKSHIHIIKSEEYFSNSNEVLKGVFKFLGASAPTEALLKEMAKVGAPEKEKTSNTHQMLPEARKLLSEFYRPANAQLAKLLKDDYYLSWSKI